MQVPNSRKFKQRGRGGDLRSSIGKYIYQIPVEGFESLSVVYPSPSTPSDLTVGGDGEGGGVARPEKSRRLAPTGRGARLLGGGAGLPCSPVEHLPRGSALGETETSIWHLLVAVFVHPKEATLLPQREGRL